jgi:hypothetical protein
MNKGISLVLKDINRKRKEGCGAGEFAGFFVIICK